MQWQYNASLMPANNKYLIKFLQESLNSIGLQETNGGRFEAIKEEGEETDYDGIGPNTNQTFTTEVYF